MAPTLQAHEIDGNLFDALLDAARRFGSKKPILEDQERHPLSYNDLIRAAFALGRRLSGLTRRGAARRACSCRRVPPPW